MPTHPFVELRDLYKDANEYICCVIKCNCSNLDERESEGGRSADWYQCHKVVFCDEDLPSAKPQASTVGPSSASIFPPSVFFCCFSQSPDLASTVVPCALHMKAVGADGCGASGFIPSLTSLWSLASSTGVF